MSTRFAPTASAGGLDPRLQRLEWQPVLFAQQPRRWELMKVAGEPCSHALRLRIHRNHGFESAASVMVPYLALRDWRPEFEYSDYDDSLNFRVGGRADVEIVWLDYSRYAVRNPALEFASWLRERMLALRQLTDSPIILVNWPEQAGYARAVQEAFETSAIPGLLVGSLEVIGGRLGKRLLDERLLRVSGSRLSDAATILIARELACRWIPAAVTPRLKAVALDLDNTLFGGVIGEDGPEGVELTPGHRALQAHLVELRRTGIFLALVSRNEDNDVRRLFSLRTDFPLRWEHFSARQTHWGSKAESVQAVARHLRVGTDAILYVDDNVGELAAVAEVHPNLCIVHAHSDASLTLRVLEYFPGLWSHGDERADALRVKDLESDAERQEMLRRASSWADYFRSLQVSLVFRLNPRAELSRLHELSQKTNQFNLALKRFSQAEIERRFADPRCKIVSIEMKDRLSESGVIGAVFAREESEAIVVDELCISCRALGRRLEDVMVAKALDTAWPEWPNKQLIFEQVTGPRNGPARQWLRNVAGDAWQANGRRIPAPASFLCNRPEYALLDIAIERTDGQ